MFRDFDEMVAAEVDDASATPTQARETPQKGTSRCQLEGTEGASRSPPARSLRCMVLAACGGDDDGGGPSDGGDVEITLAHSYTEDQPQHRCGAQVIADEVEKADVGMTVEVFPASQLGADADRISSVVSGDIDMDIQGASALGAVYEPVSVLDAAYAFDDSDHLARYFESDAVDGAAPGLRGRDRGPHARRLVGRDAAVHGQRADP